MEFFKKLAKTTAVMFAVGALLGLAAPAIGSLLGAGILGTVGYTAATTTPVLWTAAFFGAFGAINSGVSAIADKIMPAAPVPVAQAAVTTTTLAPVEPEPQIETTKFRDQLAASRAQTTGATR